MMLVSKPAISVPRPFPFEGLRVRSASRAFTLMELMVSVAILVIILLSVGVIFGGASRSVSNSQAIMEMLANVRAVQQVVEQDVRGMDRNGFLVIRSRVWNTNTADLPTQPNPPPPVNLRFIDVSPHYD
jgi:prepilin-type N-terminal cleavage/methylation domain-containing protein